MSSKLIISFALWFCNGTLIGSFTVPRCCTRIHSANVRTIHTRNQSVAGRNDACEIGDDESSQVMVQDIETASISNESLPATSNNTSSPASPPNPILSSRNSEHSRASIHKRKIKLAWCNHGNCQEAIREKVVGEHNHMELVGPATGQVTYRWEQYPSDRSSSDIRAGAGKAVRTEESKESSMASPPAVLILVKRNDDELTKAAAGAINELIPFGVQVLIDSTLEEDLIQHDVDLDCDMIRRFEPKPVPGFGAGDQLFYSGDDESLETSTSSIDKNTEDCVVLPAGLFDADLIVTLGGDGLLMYAAHVFSGPVPPILPVAGGSMGFLTPFAREDMVEAVLISLGLIRAAQNGDTPQSQGVEPCKNQVETSSSCDQVVPSECYLEKSPIPFGNNNQICISMRMRLDCRVFGSDGLLRSRYNVLNEVVIDRGSSPYLASLECFCDDVHLTTVQADGIIFATPTGSTAYSMAAGGSVVHPAVPAILVTPICPHVLSFRSMVFPDHVVLRCYVPNDARSTACVYFDGKHRTELHRGDSVQIEMSTHPVPTINRADHSSDWLSSLKRNFNFNTRVRQNPLR